jgi:hypothetical protein
MAGNDRPHWSLAKAPSAGVFRSQRFAIRKQLRALRRPCLLYVCLLACSMAIAASVAAF